MSKDINEKLDQLGITKNTVIVEIHGGVLQEVHNAPNDDWVLFDWDNIPQDACDLGEDIDNYTQDRKKELDLMLETLKEKA